MTNAPPLLALQHISRHFQTGDDRLTVLDNINLDIHAGEMVAIIGASGSGKSTLMNILGCLDRPSHGEYRVNGQSTATLNSDQLADLRNQKIGFVFQGFNLFPTLTAVQNVELALDLRGIRGSTARSQAVLRGSWLSCLVSCASCQRACTAGSTGCGQACR